MASPQAVVVLITAASQEEARRLADALLATRLAACVSILPRVNSFFWWQGTREAAEEHLLMVKTVSSLLSPLIETVKSVHSYAVPEVVALPVIGGNQDYLDWVTRETRTRPEGD